MQNQKIRCYSELSKLVTFEERYNYLKMNGHVGQTTFGFDRYLNQVFYHDKAWQRVREYVAFRDSNGDEVCDLGILDRPIGERVYVHHLNPIKEEDILNRADWILDPEFLICCSFNTHNAIHYGDESLLIHEPIIRRPNDTCPWR